MGGADQDNIYQIPQVEIVGALQEVLPESDAEFMQGMDQSEAIIFLSRILAEQGVIDPLVYLKEKGILE